MAEIDNDPVRAVKTVRDIVRDVLNLLIKTNGYRTCRHDIRALWATARQILNEKPTRLDFEGSARDSLLIGLAAIERGMLMELGNLKPNGHYWSPHNGIEFPVTAFDVRLIALIAHLAAIYVLDIAEDIELERLLRHEGPIVEEDIPF
jgi:hypothetical protein